MHDVIQLYPIRYFELYLNQNDFLTTMQIIGVARILDWVGPNHKSHAMTSSEIFKKGAYCGTKISQGGRSEGEACFWHLTRILLKGEGLLKLKVK